MKIILVGNQNSGKTTIYNFLTGNQEKTGNWPGVTIDYKVSKIMNTEYFLIDLPGIYSLSPYSKEELIATSYLIDSKYDLIVNVIDFNLIERSLFLTLELLDLNRDIIIILTHTSNYSGKYIKKCINILESNLNIKVIDMKELEKDVNMLFMNINIRKNKHINIFSNDMEILMNKFSNNRYESIIRIKGNKFYSNFLESKYGMDVNEIIAFQRYKYIEKITNNIKIKKTNNYLDKILLNKIFGIPIFILVMFFIYYFSIIIVGNISTDFIINIFNWLINKIIDLLNQLNVYKWLISLITNGIIKGISVLISFIPQLLTIFVFTEILNQTGYITRITYLLDGLLKKMGLSGKSVICFLIGSGCSVPGIIQSRIIGNELKRDKTILLVPFIPCSAKLPIILLISNYLKIDYLIIVIYLLSVIIIVISSLILNKIYIIDDSDYVMEIPNYRIPKFNYLIKEVINKLKDFVKRIGFIILMCSIIIWIFLNVFINNVSLLYFIGSRISFIFYPFLGNNNWKLSVSILQGLIAREQVVTSLSILTNNNLGVFTKPTILSFLVFNMFSIPCVNSIIAIKNELKSAKKLMFNLLFQFVVAFFVSVIVYRIGVFIW